MDFNTIWHAAWLAVVVVGIVEALKKAWTLSSRFEGMASIICCLAISFVLCAIIGTAFTQGTLAIAQMTVLTWLGALAEYNIIKHVKDPIG